MQAFRLLAPQHTALVEVDRPEPRTGQVVIRVGSASFCHSDLALVDLPPGVPGIPLPVTLGHEMAGRVDAVGAGVTGWEHGDAVAVHVIQGCGECRWCLADRDNLCGRFVTPGVHYDGGLAEYVAVPARKLVRLDGVDMTQAAPLTDAGLTAYHAVDLARSLLRPDATALVVGIGGLGHIAVQIVRATSAARVFAVDVKADRLDLARRLGAEEGFLAGDDAALTSAIRAANSGDDVDVVFDFVGSQATVDLAALVARKGGAIVVTGLGDGHVPLVSTMGSPPGVPRVKSDTTVVNSFAGNRADLVEVLALAARGKLRVETTSYPLSRAAEAFDALARSEVLGRAVVVPGS